MNAKFRLAIVGCGRIAARHFEASLAIPDIEIVGLIDPTLEHARQLATRFAADVKCFSRVEEVTGRIDGAIIATPNHLHKDTALACLQAGVSTLIEKPLATTVVDGEEICRTAEKHGAFVAVAYVTRFGRSVRLMDHLISSRYFGRIRKFAYQSGSKGGWAPLSGYNLDRAATGGGVLVVTGTHFLDRMLNWFGYPTAARLQHDSLGGPEANAFADFEFCFDDACLTGCARFSKTVVMRTGFAMETDAGHVLLDDSPEAAIRLLPFDRPEIVLNIANRNTDDRSSSNLFQAQLQDFVAAVRNCREPIVTGRQGLQSLRLMDQLYAEARPIAETNSCKSAEEATFA